MIRHTKILLAALGALGALAGSSVSLARDNMCMANDKRVPDKSTTCRYGTLWVCDKGEWKSLEAKCSS